MTAAEARERQSYTRDLSNRAMRMPLLTEEHERELIERWQSAADRAALDKLVLAHVRMVVAQAHRYRSFDMALDDLVQEGSVGLMEATRRFDLSHGVRFSTYAIWWVRAAIQAYILRNWSVVRIGTTRAEKRLFFNLRRLRARAEQVGSDLSESEIVEQLADALQTTPEVIGLVGLRISGRDRSGNEPVGEEANTELQDLIVDPNPTPEQSAVSRIDGEKQLRSLEDAIANLPSREQLILRRRHLAENGETLESLSQDLGVSKERVRQLECRALNRMREALQSHCLSPGGNTAFN
jgi:RNA polymerase sigma-32 factor